MQQKEALDSMRSFSLDRAFEFQLSSSSSSCSVYSSSASFHVSCSSSVLLRLLILPLPASLIDAFSSSSSASTDSHHFHLPVALSRLPDIAIRFLAQLAQWARGSASSAQVASSSFASLLSSSSSDAFSSSSSSAAFSPSSSLILHSGYVKRTVHDFVVPYDQFSRIYSRLKRRFASDPSPDAPVYHAAVDCSSPSLTFSSSDSTTASLASPEQCENWVRRWRKIQSTDPTKYVFEDLGIAAFLIALWEQEQQPKQHQQQKQGNSEVIHNKPRFLDLGLVPVLVLLCYFVISIHSIVFVLLAASALPLDVQMREWISCLHFESGRYSYVLFFLCHCRVLMCFLVGSFGRFSRQRHRSPKTENLGELCRKGDCCFQSAHFQLTLCRFASNSFHPDFLLSHCPFVSFFVGHALGQACLDESVLDPTDLIDDCFPDADWLIGNHPDELTPFIPLLAARSGHGRARFFFFPAAVGILMALSHELQRILIKKKRKKRVMQKKWAVASLSPAAPPLLPAHRHTLFTTVPHRSPPPPPPHHHHHHHHHHPGIPLISDIWHVLLNRLVSSLNEKNCELDPQRILLWFVLALFLCFTFLLHSVSLLMFLFRLPSFCVLFVVLLLQVGRSRCYHADDSAAARHFSAVVDKHMQRVKRFVPRPEGVGASDGHRHAARVMTSFAVHINSVSDATELAALGEELPNFDPEWMKQRLVFLCGFLFSFKLLLCSVEKLLSRSCCASSLIPPFTFRGLAFFMTCLSEWKTRISFPSSVSCCVTERWENLSLSLCVVCFTFVSTLLSRSSRLSFRRSQHKHKLGTIPTQRTIHTACIMTIFAAVQHSVLPWKMTHLVRCHWKKRLKNQIQDAAQRYKNRSTGQGVKQ